MDFFQFLKCFVPEKELTEEHQQQHDFHWQEQGANSIRMPSMYKVEYSEASQREIQATWEAKRDLMDSYLESKNWEAYAEMQYVEPKTIKGYHNWSTDEGKELYTSRLDLKKVSGYIESIKYKPHYYDTRTQQGGEIESDTIRRAKQRVAQAKKAFDNIAEKMVQEDLYHYELKKAYNIKRARQAKEWEDSPIRKEREEYIAEMRKAGHLVTSLFDYSNGYEDTKVDAAKKEYNAAGKPINPDYDTHAKGASRGIIAPQHFSDCIAPIPLWAKDYKENSIAEFEAKTKPQDYTTDLIDNIAKKLKFW